MRRLLTTFLLFSMFATSAWAPAAAPEPPRKLSQRAYAATGNGATDLLIQAHGYPDLSAARSMTDKTARTRFVFTALTTHAAQAQRGLRAALATRGLAYMPLWISNQIWVRNASRADALWLANRVDIERVDLDVTFRGTESASVKTHWQPSMRASSSAIEWGVQRVRAPEVWSQGITGTGIIIADLDTGVRWDHPALKAAYRGWDGVTVTHNYNWFDAAGTSVGNASAQAFDDNGHGTHTVGTILGDDLSGNQVGVAPGARWIGCRNMLFNVGSVARYSACFQFALAPTDVNGNNPDPLKAADITSNSWGCFPPESEVGCSDPTALITITQSLRDAGIFVIASAGNSGSSCNTISSAAAMLDQAFTVGATNSGDFMAGFSSRGPSTLTGRVKPDLVAPGENVRSSTWDGGYGGKSGTSMAAPHVAGVTALLLSAAPELRGQVNEVELILRRTARPLPSNETCGGVPGSARPNNTSGYGLIDAKSAIDEARLLRNPVVLQSPNPLPNTIDPVTVTLTLTNGYQNLNLANQTLSFTVPLSTNLLSMSSGAFTTTNSVTWSITSLAPAAVITRQLVIQRTALAPTPTLTLTHIMRLPLITLQCPDAGGCLATSYR
jgi:serine protease AprX